MRQLSGGERARLALALITREAPHMLILDEPTNHLDVDAREALVQALNQYGGAVIIVSHDRHLLGADGRPARAGRRGRAKEFAGSLDDYRDMVLGRGESGAKAGGNAGAKPGGKQDKRMSRKDERRLAAQARQRDHDLRKSAERPRRK